ncbi:MAG: DTW domain-containing protein [Bacteriovoracaceae bacterium]|nr:DTW domain-containing protein [Bacteriovoracaceae bacterium]
MDREQYLKQKDDQLKEFDEAKRRTSCFTCRRKIQNCLCHAVSPFDSSTIISLLMHPKEAKKQRIGTGYLTKATVKNSYIFSDVNLDENRDFLEFLHNPLYHHVLLYPANNPDYIDEGKMPESWKKPLREESKILVLHVLDATWPCAKKMMRLSICLQELPKVSFKNSYRSRFVIKHQPHSDCLSTIETVHHCFNGLEEMGHEEIHGLQNNLLKALDALVSFQIKCELDPELPSTRGKKPKKPKNYDFSRIREKKNRLFYWDTEISPTGTKNNKES